jgi:hypothetical protein
MLSTQTLLRLGSTNLGNLVTLAARILEKKYHLLSYFLLENTVQEARFVTQQLFTTNQ